MCAGSLSLSVSLATSFITIRKKTSTSRRWARWSSPESRCRSRLCASRSSLTAICSPKQLRDSANSRLQTPRSPFTLTKSLLVAEYQEWPLQGFLKRTKIKRDNIQSWVQLSIPSEALDISSGRELPARPSIGRDAVLYSKMRTSLTAIRCQTKRTAWKPEEDAILIEIRKNWFVGRDSGCPTWLEEGGDLGALLHEV